MCVKGGEENSIVDGCFSGGWSGVNRNVIKIFFLNFEICIYIN